MKYVKTVVINKPQDFDTLHPGQWFIFAGAGGTRGQWFGKTRAGVDYVRHQPESRNWGIKTDTERARSIRASAKRWGAK